MPKGTRGKANHLDWMNLMINGEAFGGEGFTGTPAAGQRGFVQLWNPVGSGKIILLRQWRDRGNNTNRYVTNHQLSTLQSPQYVSNMRAGSATTAEAEIYIETGLINVVIPPANSWFYFDSQSSIQNPSFFPAEGSEWAAVIPEGFGFASHQGVAIQNVVSMLWAEVDDTLEGETIP